MPDHGELFQKQLIEYGACTFGRMKTGSLFRILRKDIPNSEECMCYFDKQCSPFGYHICVLQEIKEGCLVYVYNAHKLEYILSEPSIQIFLSDFGYDVFDVDTALQRLKQRLHEQSEFPHEIGIFLGFPLQDVQAFITPQKKCKLVGYWKVYGNVKKFQKVFYRYDCCTKTFVACLNQGETFVQILKKCNELTH